mgnify:CR=1 FL=1
MSERNDGAFGRLDRPVLLFDGECGFCSRSVRFILRRDRQRRTLLFAPLSSPIGEAVVERHPRLREMDTVVWFAAGATPTEDVVLVRSDAALRIARYLGGVYAVAAVVGGAMPRVLRDRAYDAVARRRKRLASACELPRDGEGARIVEWLEQVG